MSGEVTNWLPGEPGKYVTILDLKERWMKKKKKQQEEEEEKKRKEAEKERERLEELKIGGKEDRRKSGRRGWRSGRSSFKVVAGGGGVEERASQAGDGEVVRVLKTERNECKKKDLEVDDVRGNVGGEVGNDKSVFGGSGIHHSGRRVLHKGKSVKGKVSDGTRNADDVGDEKASVEQNVEVGSLGGEEADRINCPCHSRSENQNGGGFWVCKYVESVSGAEIEDGVKGNDVVEVNMVDVSGNSEVGKEESTLSKKHRLPSKVGDEMTVELEKGVAVHANGGFSRVANSDDMQRKTWQPRGKWEKAKGIKSEEFVKQKQKEVGAVEKDGRRMINHDGSGQKSNGNLQMAPVESSVEAEDCPKASEVTERETNYRREFKARGNQVGGRKINDTERLKAERISNKLTTGYVKKRTMHVNSSCKKPIDEIVIHSNNDDLTLKLENMEPIDGLEKSDATVGSEMVEISSCMFMETGNEVYPREKLVNWRLRTDRNVANERTTNTKNINGWTRETRVGKERSMWVKKGDASVGHAGIKN